MQIIMLGVPGAGKGAQAELIKEKFSIPAISTGEIIRDALKSGSDMGNKAQSFIKSGKLLPDDLVINIIKDRLDEDDCKNGFILDGFPRTIPQAEALEQMGVIIDKVINIELPDQIVINRLSGRRICENCGATYNLLHKKPETTNTCDKCAGTLIQRKDDNEETIKERLKVYHNETEPLKEYYLKQNKMFTVDGDQEINKIAQDILECLEA